MSWTEFFLALPFMLAGAVYEFARVGFRVGRKWVAVFHFQGSQHE